MCLTLGSCRGVPKLRKIYGSALAHPLTPKQVAYPTNGSELPYIVLVLGVNRIGKEAPSCNASHTRSGGRVW